MKIFVIGGKARTGKNTLGNYLMEEAKKYGYKPCVMRLTEPLYSYARNYFDWSENTGEKPREFLQKMGIEIIKEKLHKNYFLIDRTCEDIEILDVVTIKLERGAYDDLLDEEERKHITETEIDDYKDFDYIIKNTGIDELRKEASSIIKNEEM